MYTYRLGLVALALVHQLSWASPQQDVRASMRPDAAMMQSEYDQTLKDIKTTLGLVPSFFKQYPQEGLPGAWALFKNVQLNPNSAIPPKYKELLGLAVSSQIPCDYCAYFHTSAAKLNGASDVEVKEAIAMGALERQWSTFINGSGNDDQFRQETDAMFKYMRDQRARGEDATAAIRNMNFDTPEEAYQDIERCMGMTPTFMKQFPRDGVVGAWKQAKSIMFNPNTAIPPKYKNLISLAVSSQIPCTSCIYWDTNAAKLDGASDDERNEAVAMASISRHWSTVLNGTQTDRAAFKKETDKILNHLKSQRPGTK